MIRTFLTKGPVKVKPKIRQITEGLDNLLYYEMKEVEHEVAFRIKTFHFNTANDLREKLTIQQQPGNSLLLRLWNRE